MAGLVAPSNMSASCLCCALWPAIPVLHEHAAAAVAAGLAVHVLQRLHCCCYCCCCFCACKPCQVLLVASCPEPEVQWRKPTCFRLCATTRGLGFCTTSLPEHVNRTCHQLAVRRCTCRLTAHTEQQRTNAQTDDRHCCCSYQWERLHVTSWLLQVLAWHQQILSGVSVQNDCHVRGLHVASNAESTKCDERACCVHTPYRAAKHSRLVLLWPSWEAPYVGWYWPCHVQCNMQRAISGCGCTWVAQCCCNTLLGMQRVWLYLGCAVLLQCLAQHVAFVRTCALQLMRGARARSSSSVSELHIAPIPLLQLLSTALYAIWHCRTMSVCIAPSCRPSEHAACCPWAASRHAGSTLVRSFSAARAVTNWCLLRGGLLVPRCLRPAPACASS